MRITRFALLAVVLLSFYTTEARVCADSLKIVSVYPNPSSGKFTLNLQVPQPGEVTVKVLNASGSEVAMQKTTFSTGPKSVPIDLSAQPSGMYFATAQLGSISSNSIKVVMQKKAAERGDSMDIIHYDLNLNIRNLSAKSIDGFATIKVRPKVDSLTTIKFDLLKLTVSNVSINNNPLPFSQNDSELFVTLNMRNPNQLPDSTLSLKVDYSGQPVTDASWGGFYFNGNYAFNMGVGFRSYPHNFGRCWFPCFDNFTDRATYDFHITTDATFMAVCNGLKQPEVLNGDGSTTWHWSIAQPIPTYQASVAVGKYALVKSAFTGQNGTYPVWIAVEAQDTLKAKASFAKVNNALQCFEDKFGPYPFDRVGYVGVPFNAGAMEHATNIAYPIYAIDGSTNYETLFAHELSHMWWGDKATCRTAEDMWLNEGWASFCEALFLECVYGKPAYITDMKKKLVEGIRNATTDDGGFYPVSGIPQTITYGTHVYKKGALMVNTLRTVMGDSAFFAACKSYLGKHMFKDVSSEDLKAEFQPFTTADLTNFFNVWIYEKGHVDMVATHFGNYLLNATYYLDVHISQLQRYKTSVSTNLPLTITAYDLQGNSNTFTFLDIDTGFGFKMLLTGMDTAAYIIINENAELGLGKTLVKQTIKNTGTINFSDVYGALNVQQVPDSAVLVMEHHWTGPTQGNLRLKGIRISPERYWHVDGILPATFKSWAFFNYDGSPNAFLDNELINKTEDSLVLLYRPFPDAEWNIATDLTFQPGGSKTDKVGRFWINELKKGDYAFGMRDVSVVGVKEQAPAPSKNSFTIIPNPAGHAQSITLQLDKPAFVDTITVIDQSGKQLMSQAVHQSINRYELDITKLKTGSYVIVLSGPQGNQSKSFVK